MTNGPDIGATQAVVFERPGALRLRDLALDAPGAGDIVVDIAVSAISTGTERLLWTGAMPPFPGMGYPLVPGYEAVGRIRWAGPESGRSVGERVFTPGARCYGDVHGLFGAASSRAVLPGARAAALPDSLDEDAVLLALAATARRAVAATGARPPELIVGHGVLGRLIARVALALGHPAPVVWETDPARRADARGYRCIDPAADERRDYQSIYDVSGDAGLLDSLIGRLSPGGEITLAGFYHAPLSFAFPPAFMREARLRISAEWKPDDLAATIALAADGRLPLDGLITHRRPAADAETAYGVAFEDPACLKMTLDWSAAHG